MIETIGHIKNPLTVIAIFAGLAEVSGTVVLPFLQPDTQRVYMWFLMLFPCLLVGLFFLTLFRKHHVLYAPSDFRSDESFTGIFTSASNAGRVLKLEQEVHELEAAERLDEMNQVSEKGLSFYSRRNIRASAFLAEELVIAALGQELGVTFERNVALTSNQRLVFDAVAQMQHRMLVVEVKYSRTGRLGIEQIDSSFARIRAAYERLPSDRQSSFQVIFAVAYERADTVSETLRETITQAARSQPFSTQVRIFDLSALEANLEREAGVSSHNRIQTFSTRIVGLLGAGKSMSQADIIASLGVAPGTEELSEVQTALGQLVLTGQIEADRGSSQNYKLVDFQLRQQLR